MNLFPMNLNFFLIVVLNKLPIFKTVVSFKKTKKERINYEKKVQKGISKNNR